MKQILDIFKLLNILTRSCSLLVMWKPRSPGLPLSDDNVKEKQRRTQMSRTLNSKLIRVVGGVVVVLCLLFLLSSNAQSGTKPVKKIETGKSSTETSSSFECSRSFDGKRPVQQYVVMIDAGSSGSRVHVYEFNNCLEMPRLVKEEFKMLEPGLSSYANDPEGAANSLNELLDLAVSTVPEDKRKCTPIAVKATAGLRKLGEEGSKTILEAVRKHLETKYPFPVVEGDGVSIMPGENEGVYAWVTANYLLENIGTSSKDPTVAVFDLGGGSTQIVFEPTFKDAGKAMSAGDHKFELSFGGRDFELYQHSYLGYGLYEAENRINEEIVAAQMKAGQDVGDLVNPCLPPGTKWTTKVNVRDGTTVAGSGDTVGKQKKEITFHGPSVSSPVQCRAVCDQVLEKGKVCANPPCAFDGVYQPRFFDAFPEQSQMYVFSFFYDRTFPLGMPETFSLSDLKDLADKVCLGPAAYDSFSAVPEAVGILEKSPQWCMHLNYMYGLLHTGYEIHPQREVRIAKKIKDNELGWCLGASLELLDGINWKCKAV